MPVGRGLGHGVGGDDAARAGLVVDDDGLAQLRGQLLRHHARGDVGHAACAKGHDDADGLVRQGLCLAGDGCQQQGRAGQGAAREAAFVHG
ncbi:hypothetical protein COLO4_01909, partial [Corchorus olitorius]